jgi:hypothetical protein
MLYYHIILEIIIRTNIRVCMKCYLYEQMIDLLYLVELSYRLLLN